MMVKPFSWAMANAVGLALLCVVNPMAWGDGAPDRALRIDANWQGAEDPRWPMSRIRCEPDAYFEHVIGVLRRELESITPRIQELELSVDELTHQIDGQSQLLTNTRQLAEEFRRHYRQAARDGCWPVEIYGKAYSRERLESQICRLAVRAASFSAAIGELQVARERAEMGLEVAENRPTQIEAQIIITQMVARLHRAQQIPSRGSELLASIESLIADPAYSCEPDQLLQALASCRPIKPLDGRRRTIARRYLGFQSPPSVSEAEGKQSQVRRTEVAPIFLQKK